MRNIKPDYLDKPRQAERQPDRYTHLVTYRSAGSRVTLRFHSRQSAEYERQCLAKMGIMAEIKPA